MLLYIYYIYISYIHMYTFFLQDQLKILLHKIGPLVGLEPLKHPGEDWIWLCFAC